MRNRKGILLVSFDLPTFTEKQRSSYRKFRSGLIKNGFHFLQESLYYKLINNTLGGDAEIKNISSFAPDNGEIIALPLTLQELSKVQEIIGNRLNINNLNENVFFF